MASAIHDDGRGRSGRNGSATTSTLRNGTALKPAPPPTLSMNGSALSRLFLHPEPRTQDDESTPVPNSYAPLFPENYEGSDNEAQGSGQAVTSPSSVTSPPYWSSHADHRAVKRLSTMSTESALPPGAITLQDNEYDDGPDGSNAFGRDRNRACWAKSVEVRDYVVVNGSKTNIGAFAVWNIRVETLNVRPCHRRKFWKWDSWLINSSSQGSRMDIRKRYSEFDDLRRRLIMTFPNFEAAVPALPPKSVISKFKPRFLEKRRAGLQYFLK